MNHAADQQTKDFYSSYSTRRIKKGHILMYPGEEPPGAVYIINGQVRQYDITHKGNEIVVNVYKEGAIVPLPWVLLGTVSNFFYDAFTDLTYKVAPRDSVLQYIKSSNDVAYSFLEKLMSGVEGQQRRLTHLMGGTGHDRVVCELIIECRRFGKLQANGTYNLKMREEEIARRAGLSRETVSRELAKLKNAGYVTFDRAGLHVKNIDELETSLNS